MSHLLRWACLPVLFALLAARGEAASLYTITDLGTPPGTTQSIATGINDLGQVIGYANNPSDGYLGPEGNPRPFLYSNGQITPITPIGGGVPNAINDSGQIVGGQYTSINNSGQYVGVVQGKGVLVSGGTTTSLGDFQPVAINDSGVIAGQVSNPSYSTDPAIYRNGQVTDLVKTLGLDTLSGQSIAINQAGDVYFYFLNLKDRFDSPNYMILKANGQLLNANYSVAMNNSNQLVGSYFWENGHQSQLTDLLVPSSKTLGQGLRATAINDAGQIVGVGVLSDGSAHAFLMTPVVSTPEPSTLAVLAAGAACIALRWVARRSRTLTIAAFGCLDERLPGGGARPQGAKALTRGNWPLGIAGSGL